MAQDAVPCEITNDDLEREACQADPPPARTGPEATSSLNTATGPAFVYRAGVRIPFRREGQNEGRVRTLIH
jgi:hypothetical protein